ncbi:MAG TPA: FAD-dependent oxidoreductase, partial [Anaerolinea sp.]|nr:FAD-dependent oxidoreductase [Anaerolinea sp.]
MADYRVQDHPILDPAPAQRISFYWQGKQLSAVSGETIAAALFAHGIYILGHHPGNGASQSLFCANGQCSQCMVIADGLPVKACMQPVGSEMRVEPCDGLPTLPPVEAAPPANSIPIISTPVLIIGGGPAGISAAIELGKSGVEALLIDDKPTLGGKLLLQTHRFFGSTEAVYAGTRGIDIAARLSEELSAYPKVTVWTNTTAVAVFSDQKVGVVKGGKDYCLVEPRALLVAAGAREKFLAFPGNSLPGVFGAGAFQTLVNRDLVKPAERVFIIGGGNVGLIAGYHALQAGIQVAGLAEIPPAVGGYKVHRDKLARLGVPIFTSHTILRANGDRHVESVTIAGVDEQFRAIPSSERTFACDALLIAVGLDPIQEFTAKASAFGIPVFSAGDAEEIAEASAAIYSGKIRGAEIAQALGVSRPAIPSTWLTTMEVLKSHPGPTTGEQPLANITGVFPVLHCTQEIPCDPCVSLCPHGLLRIDPDDIRKTPVFVGDAGSCKACLACVAGCPGLAITLVDTRKNAERLMVTIPWEFPDTTVAKGDEVLLV